MMSGFNTSSFHVFISRFKTISVKAAEEPNETFRKKGSILIGYELRGHCALVQLLQ